ncbi:MAG: hypothetical protein II493_08070 [Spirochaetales bacterium]|nr:hypothetical protein [Spirochaetales bacterium]
MRCVATSRRQIVISILIALAAALLLTGCSSGQNTCWYAYFGECAYAMVYTPSDNGFTCIQLPLEQILRWGKASGLDSIPMAMRNYVGLKDTGFLLGTPESLRSLRDILDALGSESGEQPSGSKRVETMCAEAEALSRRPALDRLIPLCGQDVEGMLKLLAGKKPECRCYDVHGIFNTDDLNFSQRYFTQWLGQVLGGNK